MTQGIFFTHKVPVSSLVRRTEQPGQLAIMYGLVFEIVEEWVIEKQGIEKWHAIKQKAGCSVKDHYEELVDLILAASELLGVAVPDLLEAFGHYVIRHYFLNRYDDLLGCQGSTLRTWLSNLNAMHDHVQKTFPGENFQAPIFWSEDCDGVEGSIMLHYYSLRGALLVPMVVGIVDELASFHFEVEVKIAVSSSLNMLSMGRLGL
jgi:guanylate cyclase soluble subunit beta